MRTVFTYPNMKALRVLAAAAGVLCAVSLFAQEGRPERRGERGAFPEPVTDSVWIVQRTQEMVEKYTLTDEQAEAVRAINTKYAAQMNFTPQRMGMVDENGERIDFRSMTDEQRQAFFQKMQERLKARKDYEEELEGILDKSQLKAYRKDRRREEGEMQRRMQGGNRGPGMGGPGGFPGGGMGGPGGFPGGGPGGFGGF